MTRRPAAPPELLGGADLLVIGGGPVGIAALWFAGRSGMDAVALEASSSALDALRRFIPGLVMASTAPEWEIDGLPLDCRDMREVTRDDLLGYYGRVIAHGKLRVACCQRVVGIAPLREGVRVEVETDHGPGAWLAKRVIVTPWYRRRALDLGPSIHVPGAVSGAPVVGEEVVVVGAGISGLEVADLVIRSGGRVTLLSKRRRALSADQATLFRVSGSRLIQDVRNVSAAAPNTLAIEHEGTVTHVPCTVAFNCTGHETNADLLAVLRRAELLTDAECSALARFRQADLREERDLDRVATDLPPLADALWLGRRGVRFAGTLFHVGGIFGAGILYSIATARWAVDASAGAPAGVAAPAPEEHLPSWFLRRMREDPSYLLREPRCSEALASIIPVPVPTWSRGTRIFEGETGTGRVGLEVSHATRALGDARDPALTDLREVCYEGLSVAELGAKHGIDRADLLSGLSDLWYGNGLTWIPPGRGETG